jgi:ribosomal protein S1
MVDYDEFGDEEYEELYEELEELVEAADVELQVGDKVVGSVYEVDEDGAYVEIGQKYSGFVPLSECSFARLKTVSLNRSFSQFCADSCVSLSILSSCLSLWKSCALE